MEFNTSSPRINKEVIEILKPSLLADPFKGTIKEGCECKYQIINLKDLEKYIDVFAQQELAVIMDHIRGNIEHGREQEGKKPFNNYIVTNVDEPYINDIVAVLEDNGHWDGKPSTTPNIVDYSNKVRSKMLDVILKLQKAEHKVFELDEPTERPIGVLISEALHELHQIHDYFEPDYLK